MQTANPAVAQAPKYYKWTMEVTTFSATGTAQRRVVMVTLTGEILSEKVAENGKHEECYKIGPIEYKTGAGPEDGKFLRPGTVAMEDGSFPEFAWVDQRFLLGTTLVQNQRCIVYADIHGKPIPTTGDPSQKLTELLQNESVPATSNVKRQPGILQPAFLANDVRIACVDAETRLPALLQTGFEVRSYAFTPLPRQEQPLPKKVQEEKALVERTNQALFAPFARP